MTTVEIIYGVEGDWGLMSGARQLDAHIFKALGLRSPAFLLEMCKTKILFLNCLTNLVEFLND